MSKLLSTLSSWLSTVRKIVSSGISENEEGRQFLSRFGGGRIKLTKNTESGMAFIEIDHMEKKNAITGKMMVDLRDCIEELQLWQEGKGVIIYGAGKNFCSGGDLDFVKQIPGEKAGSTMGHFMAKTLHSMQKLPLVTMCVLTGPSLGGGAEIATHCDYILVADNVKFGFVHGKIGIPTAFGGTTALTQRIGKYKALDLLLTGKVMNAEECMQVGFADAVVGSENALEQAVEWFKAKLIHDARVVRAFKETCAFLEPGSRKQMVNFEIFQLSKFWGAPLNQSLLAQKIKHA